MAKKLNVKNLLKEAKKLYKQEECALLIDNEEYTFKYDTYFTNTKIEGLINDVLKLYHQLNINPEIDPAQFGFVTTIYLLIIKHFTTIDIPPVDDLNKLGQCLKALVDTGVMETIVDALPQDQIQKVLIKVGEVGQKIGERAELLKEKTESEITNPELKRALFNGVVKDIHQENVEKGENE